MAIDDTLLRITFGDDLGPIELPALRARVTQILPVAGRELLIVSFGADSDPLASQDLIAIIGWDGSQLRILGIESLTWHRQDGADLSLRLFAVADRKRLMLAYSAAIPRGSPAVQRMSWEDFLAWQDGAPMENTPPRPPLPNTWQSHLGATRAKVIELLSTPKSAISVPMLAATGLLRPQPIG
jgi:hypothetical protein